MVKVTKSGCKSTDMISDKNMSVQISKIIKQNLALTRRVDQLEYQRNTLWVILSNTTGQNSIGLASHGINETETPNLAIPGSPEEINLSAGQQHFIKMDVNSIENSSGKTIILSPKKPLDLGVMLSPIKPRPNLTKLGSTPKSVSTMPINVSSPFIDSPIATVSKKTSTPLKQDISPVKVLKPSEGLDPIKKRQPRRMLKKANLPNLSTKKTTDEGGVTVGMIKSPKKARRPRKAVDYSLPSLRNKMRRS